MITNRSLRFAICALLLLAPLAALSAQEMSDDMMGNDEGFYVRASYLVTVPVPHKIGTTTYKTEFGFLGGQLGFGYAIFGLRPEVSAGYRVAPIEGTDGGSISSLDVIGSVYYDTDGDISLYIGLGGGISSITVKKNDDTKAESAVAPAFQAAAGLGYALTEDLTVTLGYRLNGTLESTEFSNSKDKQEMRFGHSAEVGIRFSF